MHRSLPKGLLVLLSLLECVHCITEAPWYYTQHDPDRTSYLEDPFSWPSAHTLQWGCNITIPNAQENWQIFNVFVSAANLAMVNVHNPTNDSMAFLVYDLDTCADSPVWALYRETECRGLSATGEVLYGWQPLNDNSFTIWCFNMTTGAPHWNFTWVTAGADYSVFMSDYGMLYVTETLYDTNSLVTGTNVSFFPLTAPSGLPRYAASYFLRQCEQIKGLATADGLILSGYFYVNGQPSASFLSTLNVQFHEQVTVQSITVADAVHVALTYDRTWGTVFSCVSYTPGVCEGGLFAFSIQHLRFLWWLPGNVTGPLDVEALAYDTTKDVLVIATMPDPSNNGAFQLMAVQGFSGKVLWTVNQAANASVVFIAAVALPSHSIVVNFPQASGTQLMAFDLLTGKILWQDSRAWVVRAPAMQGRLVVSEELVASPTVQVWVGQT